MDKLPGGLQLWLQQWLSKEHERPATTSKLIAYHLELWFSDNRYIPYIFPAPMPIKRPSSCSSIASCCSLSNAASVHKHVPKAWPFLCSFSKVLSLLYLTLALVWVGGLGIFAVTGESLYDAFWQVCYLSSDAFAIHPRLIQDAYCLLLLMMMTLRSAPPTHLSWHRSETVASIGLPELVQDRL